MPEQNAIDPTDLATAIRVLGSIGDLEPDHPDIVALQRATAGLFKTVKKMRRDIAKNTVRDADTAIIEATATGAPTRIDDETQGLELRPAATRSSTGAHTAGRLTKSQACYVCKEQYFDVDAFYHQLCPDCAAKNRAKRDARTDLTGKRALLTGGRAKIGMYIALRLLRDGAHTTITTRFPNDAVRRFRAMHDADDWMHRLKIVGIDLRDPAQVVALADDVAADGPLDILINNAAQTVRRSPGCVRAARRRGGRAAARRASCPSSSRSAAATTRTRAALEASVAVGGRDEHTPQTAVAHASVTAPGLLTELALTAGSASLERVADAHGDRRRRARPRPGLQQLLDPERRGRRPARDARGPAVQQHGAVHPHQPAARLDGGGERPAHVHRQRLGDGGRSSAAATRAPATRTRTWPRPRSTCSRAPARARCSRPTGILMTSVDTGWITDERPHPTKVRLAEEGFHAPLDLVDGAARVYDPIVRGEAGEDLFGCFLKDYRPSAW